MTSTNEIHIMRNTQHTIETEEDVSDEEMEEEMGEDSISHIEGAEHTNLKELHIDLDTESVLDIDKC